MIRSIVKGVGAYLPERIITNAEMATLVDTSDDWITARTGIHQRHIAADGELTSDLAIAASKDALANAGVHADDLDLIILATATPDDTFPATATVVQAALGMERGFAFDMQAVCSGFVYAVATADNFIKAGQAKNVLVIGAETFSRILDWEDRTTAVLFGDGAGAIVLQAGEGEGSNTDRGVLTTHLHSDGRHRSKLYVDSGPSRGSVGHLRMEGQEVFRHAVVNIAEAIDEALDATGLEAKDIDWFVPHQANKRILDATAKRIGLAPETVVMTVGQHANTSAASVPLALDVAVKDGRIKQGDMVLLEAMGGGFTWGSALIRW
ncbi:3-oxoacyl-[acyl-carrier-protein] synthase,KASIII [Candidatus Phaeomarinobacter ectocarpi]|uniref:Beta-ketoacyl-[acyl-carrier-protein] synthase III n=1 Tax=Candidatus Phaeomarinibacter ectocarpi TaxID=1458461 RepID=X5MNJ7_9HYPH|nr:beta-ketoacyl-ACP synthase III [Candidatus Phaeomarinobacter ectocarpi]CDO61335.1 3-oxoacyl-[acyl-carrier-protein] synthase,KASIII [Candidatus Phaeomarinobacter ectocarpi]